MNAHQVIMIVNSNRILNIDEHAVYIRPTGIYDFKIETDGKRAVVSMFDPKKHMGIRQIIIGELRVENRKGFAKIFDEYGNLLCFAPMSGWRREQCAMTELV